MNAGDVAKAAVACLEDDPACQCRLDRGEHVISVNCKHLGIQGVHFGSGKGPAGQCLVGAGTAADGHPLPLIEPIPIAHDFNCRSRRIAPR